MAFSATQTEEAKKDTKLNTGFKISF